MCKRILIALVLALGAGLFAPPAPVAQPTNALAFPLIAASRRTDWTTMGVLGGIPSGSYTQCGATIAAYTGNADTINTRVAGCADDQYVLLGAGTFTLSTGILIANDRTVLRGSGPDQTFLEINGVSATQCGYSYNSAVAMCSGGGFSTIDTNWTAGYTKGTTRITVASRASMVAGRTLLHLMQQNDAGYPTSADLWICDSGPTCNGSGSGGAGAPAGVGVAGSAVVNDTLVTACVGGTCSGAGDVDISPPLTIPNFRTGRTNVAHFGAGPVGYIGLEDLSIDHSDVGNTGIQITNATNAWVKNIRSINSGAAAYGVAVLRAGRVTIRDSYFYRTASSGQENYFMALLGTGANLIENNICQGIGCGFTSDNSYTNSVFAYNFTPGGEGPCYIRHLAGEVMNLVEGNICKNIWTDDADGMGAFLTVFRNAFVGDRYNAGGGTGNIHSAVVFNAKNRFHNMVGNVIGDAALFTEAYEGHNTSGCDGIGTSPTRYYLYQLGGDSCTDTPQAFDALVATTMLRWGNWDEITSTSPTTNGDQTGTRWCGNSSNTGWVARCGSTTEVPSAITNYPNPIPSTETLPASLYLAGKPSWFGSLPFPGIGPDVSGGTVTNLGGHVALNPAAQCYLTTMSGATDGSGGPYTFTCW